MTEKFLFNTFFKDPDTQASDVSTDTEAGEQSLAAEGQDSIAAKGIEAQSAPPPPSYSQEELLAAKTAAFAQGREEALKEARENNEKERLVLLEKVALHLEQLLLEAQTGRESALRRGMELSYAIAKKVLPKFCERHGLLEIEQIVSDCMAMLSDEPRLVIRVQDKQLDAVRDVSDAVAKRQGFEGRIVLLGAEDFGPSDVLVEWADGGGARNLEDQWREIDEILSRALTPPSPEQVTTTQFHGRGGDNSVEPGGVALGTAGR